MENKVINLVNFVRGCEPRKAMDLYAPVALELETDRRLALPHTFLLQYDAMERADFCDLFLREMRENGENTELGVWFELCRALTERVGIPWRGRPGYDWDWFTDPGFRPAYTPAERERLIDEVFRRFREIFGTWPRVAGSWLLDAHSMAYMADRYGMDAFCVCREQYAVDAYTLWGGYFNGGYYASRRNMLMPAQTEAGQIPVPVFRMLGPDPIYCFDEDKYRPTLRGCYTMEPSWDCGGDRGIMEWYFRTYYQTPAVGLAHATTGQENSFGLSYFGKTYPMQAALIDEWRRAGDLTVQTLGQTGRTFRAAHRTTPPSSLSALSDWAGNGNRSVWYSSARYRANLFLAGGHLFFRDLRLFREDYAERYLTSPCRGKMGVYDTLPAVDGRLWSSENDPSELALADGARDLALRAEGDVLTVTFRADDRSGEVVFAPDRITLRGTDAIYRPGRPDGETTVTATPTGFDLTHRDFAYRIGVNRAPEPFGTAWRLPGDGDQVVLLLDK